MKFKWCRIFPWKHKVIEIITRVRGDKFYLNYFHCKHCGKDYEPRIRFNQPI
jgi:hypothetical protein